MKLITFRRILAAILAASMCFALAGCNYDEPMTAEDGEFYLTKNDEMDEETKAALEEITTVFEAYLSDANPETIKNFLDSDFETTDEQLTQFASSYIDQKANPFTLYDSYYIKDVKPDTVTKRFKKSADAEMSVEITPGTSEMYLALYSSENEKISHMVTLLCAKDGSDWEIVWIDATDFKYKGEDAEALYKKGVERNTNGNFLSAYVYALMLNLTMRPGNALVYKDYQAMEDFYYQTATQFQKDYATPYTPEGMADTVKIHAIALANEEAGIIPLVILQTATPLTDTDALREEAQAVRDALNKKSPGFDEDFPNLAFNVVNEDPTVEGATPDIENFVLTAE